MELGTAGVPIDLAKSRDYDAIFSELANAGITVYFPHSIYEEYPVSTGLGFEADFVPPPFGSATPEIYDLAREHGIKISFGADYLFPLSKGGVDAENSPLQAILDAGGGDIIHSIVGYDEAAFNGIDPDQSRAVYEHVKSIDPNIPVVQVHAPVSSEDPTAYLEEVIEHAQWSDKVGFSVYPIATLSGARSPYTSDVLLSPVEAIEDYVAWLQTELGDHEHVMVLQGFEQLDLYSDAMIATFDDEELSVSRPPTLLEMREMMLAVEGVDTVFWWGPSLQEEAAGDIWQNILQVSTWAANGDLGTDMGLLTDVDSTVDALDEDAEEGNLIGVTLYAEDLDAIDTVSYTLDDSRFEVGADGEIRVAQGASFDYETESTILLTARASSTDGTVQTYEIDLQINDVVDVLTGTSISDTILGQMGEDRVLGYNGDDVISTLAGDDTIDAGSGEDLVYGGDGDDHIRGQSGNDIVLGEGGNDYLSGGSGDDILVAGAGNDVVDGGDGADMIMATSGDNVLIGGLGDDQMQAGSGTDTFVFGNGDGVDVVYEYDATADVLSFEDIVSMADLNIISHGTAGTEIEYEGGRVLLLDVVASDLGSDQFEFG